MAFDFAIYGFLFIGAAVIVGGTLAALVLWRVFFGGKTTNMVARQASGGISKLIRGK